MVRESPAHGAPLFLSPHATWTASALERGGCHGSRPGKSQQEARKAYDRWLRDERIEFVEEPGGLEAQFRALTRSPHASPKDWADSYLLAFASVADLRLVTFDQALRQKGTNVLLLQ